METKKISDRLIQLINEELENKRFQLDESAEGKVRVIVQMGYVEGYGEGYGDCLKEVKEGLIK